MKDIDYVELYAQKLKNNNALFKQQKMLIEAQLKGSCSLFKNMFAGSDFKKRGEKIHSKYWIVKLILE